MKIKEYIKQLQELAKIYPDADVVYAVDEEGNGYSPIEYAPSTGNYTDGEFEDSGDNMINAICVN